MWAVWVWMQVFKGRTDGCCGPISNGKKTDKTVKHSHRALKIRLYCFIYICHHNLALLSYIWDRSYHDFVQYSADFSISNQLHPGALSWHITQYRRYKILSSELLEKVTLAKVSQAILAIAGDSEYKRTGLPSLDGCFPLET